MASFNADQIKAIEAKNHTILVSAAAGSGKTTVMVEKIKQSLLNDPGKHLSNMLVITFTREAASNMRRKLQDLLLEAAADPGLGEAAQQAVGTALGEIENAHISTIHSFCIEVIRNGFHILNVDPMVRVGEESEVAALFDTAYEETMNAILDPASAEKLPGMTPDGYRHVMTLLDSFSADELLSICGSLYSALMGIPDPFDRLHELIENIDLPIDRQPWAMEILSAVKMDLYGLSSLLSREEAAAENLPAYPDVAATAALDREVILPFLEKLPEMDTVETLYAAVAAANEQIPKLKALRGLSDEDKEIYGRFKEIRGGIKGKDSLLGRAASDLTEVMSTSQIRDNLIIQEELRGLEILITQLALRFRADKQAENIIDFSDMEQMTYRLMTDREHPEIRDNLQSTFTDIYVDESQDISAIQNAIIQAVHSERNRLFMVGDVKQSIYRFRHAEPRLFMHFRDTYSMDEDAESRKIYFQDNYRSSMNVIASVNEVFAMAMDRMVNELDYEQGDYLIANKQGEYGQTEILLLCPDPVEKLNAQEMLEAQCVAAAKKIAALLNNHDSPKAEPPYRYSDIAILVRSARTDAPRMVEIFKQLHVPVYYDGAMNYYGLSEVAMFLALLNTIDNMHQDIPLISTLRQAPFYLTDRELQEIRIQAPGRVPFYTAFERCMMNTDTEIGRRCDGIFWQLHEWKLRAGTMKASEFIWQLLRETGFYAVCGAYPDGRLRQNNLDMLYQKALDLEQRGIYRLPGFLEQIAAVIDRGQKDSDSPVAASDADNCVRLMTMHKSKGLEFRAVILMNIAKDLRKKNDRNMLRIDIGQGDESRPALGLYLPVVNLEKNTKRNTYGKMAFDRRAVRNEIAEQTRLMYVAMTRAMEKLIMIGTYKDADIELWREPSRVSRIWRTRSLLDMVMPAILKAAVMPGPGETVETGPWRLSVSYPDRLGTSGKAVQSEAFNERLLAALEEQNPELLTQWNLTEPMQYPLKTSVSSMVRTEEHPAVKGWYQRQEDMEETAEEKRIPESKLVTFTLDEKPGMPKFMEVRRPTAADRGIATHRFLRLLDLAEASAVPEPELAGWMHQRIKQMADAAILEEQEAKLINVEGAAMFICSPLGRRLCSGSSVHREWPFTYRISEETGTIIQGVIDAAFMETGEWILIDYKTDHDTAPERFVARHARQMNWYREAIEHLSARPVREMWLFALRSGEAHRVPVIDVAAGVVPHVAGQAEGGLVNELPDRNDAANGKEAE